jgi:hypothetical protein
MSKIPFFIVRNFISPLRCEQIIDDLKVLKTRPMIGQNGKPKKMTLNSTMNAAILSQLFENYCEKFEQHYDCEYLGIHNWSFEWYPENTEAEPHKSDGYAKTKSGDWVRYREVDFTGILWLNDFNDETDFDNTFEVYGGKLEFPTFGISFQPERGTLILFPSAPNFFHTVSPVEAGSLTQVRSSIRTVKPYQYNKNNFEHDPNNWNIS